MVFLTNLELELFISNKYFSSDVLCEHYPEGIQKNKQMKKQFVNSSTAEALGYDEKIKTLRVWFTTGEIYDYAGVPKTKFKNLLHAASIGEYFNKKIKGFYNYKKIE